MAMRIFLTGATGFIGSAIVRELLAGGHRVRGLVRPATDATALEALGVEIVRGTLEDLAGLRRAAEEVDAVIHTAFVHDFAAFAKSCAIDQAAIDAIGEVLAGSGRAFAVTTGTPVVTGRPATETDVGERTNPISALRAPADDRTLALAERGVRAMLVRLPRSVHGASERGWKGGLVSPLVEVARATGRSAYVGDGAQRWPAVHRLDAARLYRAAIERGAAGTRWHAVDEEGVTVKAIAEAIGAKLGIPVVATSGEAAAAQLGFLAGVAGTDQPAASAHTRAVLGWQPREPRLLADFAAHVA